MSGRAMRSRRTTVGSSRSAALRGFLLVAGSCATIALPNVSLHARAQAPTAIALGIAAESATSTVAPIALLQAPLGTTATAWVSQQGWTSELGLERAIAPHLALFGRVGGAP